MVNFSINKLSSPLTRHENLPPLPGERADYGKSYVSPTSKGPGGAYEKFPAPIDNGQRGGFDIHVYYDQVISTQEGPPYSLLTGGQDSQEQATFAFELWERIRREFPELRIHKVWDRPVGPHPIAMFEVDVLTPNQFGALIPWLVIHRGPLSVLVHPNTGDDERDHTQLATWLGEKLDLDLSVFRKMREVHARLEKLKAAQDFTESAL